MLVDRTGRPVSYERHPRPHVAVDAVPGGSRVTLTMWGREVLREVVADEDGPQAVFDLAGRACRAELKAAGFWDDCRG
jgi:hypothetical protein